MLWGVYAAVSVSRVGFAGATTWLHGPLNATGVVLAIAVAVLHMHIGMREIILDYIERPISKAALLTANVFFCAAAAAAGIVAVLRVAFGAV
jgi:succinate dehydrogenase / fumarate reductase membrane anchor subunit